MSLMALLVVLVVFLYLNKFPPPPPSEIDRYASHLRYIYKQWLPQSKEPEISRFPSAGPLAPEQAPFIPPISIVVRNTSKEYLEWLLTASVDEVQREGEEEIEVEDILKPISDKKLKFILIEGEPGIGKSTLAIELVLRWANTSDKFLNEYRIVIFIQLRIQAYQNAESIAELFIEVKDLIEAEDQDINMTRLNSEVKKGKGADVLWILDGFDELPHNSKSLSVLTKLMQGKVLPESTVIVTSRHGASERLFTYLYENTGKTKHISLRGFNSVRILKYAMGFFNDTNTVSKFSSYYYSNLMIESMLYNPMNCYIVCTVFKNLTASKSKQYPRTMTWLYNEYVRVLLKRHLNGTGVINIDHPMPQHLILESDFDSDIASAWKNFSFLSKIAYYGVKEQKYIFEKTKLENIEKLSMMTTAVGSSAFDKGESSSFIHTTLQEYYAAIYLVSNSLDSIFTNKNLARNPNLQVVLTFYIGLLAMIDGDINHMTMNTLRQGMSVNNATNYVYINTLLLRLLYEHDSLTDIMGFTDERYTLMHSSKLPNSRFQTFFDFFISGYLVAAHRISYSTLFVHSMEIEAFNKGIQSQLSHSTVKGKLKIFMATFDENSLKELLLMPSDILVSIVLEFKLVKVNNICVICQITSIFKFLEEITFKTDSLFCNSSQHPLLEHEKLHTLTLGLMQLSEYDFEILNKLTAPGKPLRRLYVNCSELHYDKILSLIKRNTSLEELRIIHYCDAYSTENNLIDEVIIWHKSNNSLVNSYDDKFFDNIQYSINCTGCHIKLTSYSTTILTSLNWKAVYIHVTIYSELIMPELKVFINTCKELVNTIDFTAYSSEKKCYKIILNSLGFYANFYISDI